MAQLISVLISFLLIPILTKKKVRLSYTLLLVAGFLGIVSGIGFENIGQAITSIFIDSSSRTTILTVIMVGILGGVMKQYDILNKIVDTLLLLIRDKKKILMIIPAMIGLLVIPGGALLSAPFIYNLGEEMKLSQKRRAAINLVFRHLAMFLLPYSTSLLVVMAALPEINIFKLILLNTVFIIAVVTLGYHFFLRDVESEKSPSRENIGQNLIKLITYTSPIYIAVIINAITEWPFYITLIGSVFIVYLLGDKKDFIKAIYQSINWNTVLTVAAILVIKEMILDMEDLLGIFNNMFNASGGMISTMVIFLIASFFFGYITGNHTASLAITIPMISQANITMGLTYAYIYFAFAAGFMGYFFSPLHLCQAFTLEHMGVSTNDLYREYRFYALGLFIVLIISTLIFNCILV